MRVGTFFDILFGRERQDADGLRRGRSRPDAERHTSKWQNAVVRFAFGAGTARKLGFGFLRINRLRKVQFRARARAAPLKREELARFGAGLAEIPLSQESGVSKTAATAAVPARGADRTAADASGNRS